MSQHSAAAIPQHPRIVVVVFPDGRGSLRLDDELHEIRGVNQRDAQHKAIHLVTTLAAKPQARTVRVDAHSEQGRHQLLVSPDGTVAQAPAGSKPTIATPVPSVPAGRSTAEAVAFALPRQGTRAITGGQLAAAGGATLLAAAVVATAAAGHAPRRNTEIDLTSAAAGSDTTATPAATPATPAMGATAAPITAVTPAAAPTAPTAQTAPATAVEAPATPAPAPARRASADAPPTTSTAAPVAATQSSTSEAEPISAVLDIRANGPVHATLTIEANGKVTVQQNSGAPGAVSLSNSAPTPAITVSPAVTGTATASPTQPSAQPSAAQAEVRPASSEATRTTSSTAGPTAPTSTTSTIASPGTSGATGAAAAAADSVGGWLSGASGDGVTDGSLGTWRGKPLQIAGTWDDSEEAQTQMWDLGPGGEYGNWTEPIDVASGGFNDGDSWSAAASGAYDDRWRQGLQQAAHYRAGKGVTFIRPFHEFNGNWYPWSVRPSQEGDFITAWKRYRAIQQQVFPSAKLVYNVNVNSVGGLDWRKTWPGADQADVLGVDLYDGSPQRYESAQAWDSVLDATDPATGAPVGLNAYAAQAKAWGVPLAVPEWSGRAEQGDDPAFITGLGTWFASHAGTGPGQLLYEVMFNVNRDNDNFRLFQGRRMPQSSQAYRDAFSKPSQTRQTGTSATAAVSRPAPQPTAQAAPQSAAQAAAAESTAWSSQEPSADATQATDAAGGGAGGGAGGQAGGDVNATAGFERRDLTKSSGQP